MLQLQNVLPMKCLPVPGKKLNIALKCIMLLMEPILRSVEHINLVTCSIWKCISFSDILSVIIWKLFYTGVIHKTVSFITWDMLMFFRKRFIQLSLVFKGYHHPHFLYQRQLLVYLFMWYWVVAQVNKTLPFVTLVFNWL